jgi:hypothetical protein
VSHVSELAASLHIKVKKRASMSYLATSLCGKGEKNKHADVEKLAPLCLGKFLGVVKYG